MSILENISSCFWFSSDNGTRNGVSSIIAGALFFLGWWFIIDAMSVYPGVLPASHIICGILGTVSLIMVNSVTNEQLMGVGYSGGCLNDRGSKVWLFIGFVLGFASVIAAIWIMVDHFVYNGDKLISNWPGVSLFLQNVFIFASSLVFKFGRQEDTGMI